MGRPRPEVPATEVGRPIKRTPERMAAIIAHVRAGSTLTDAAQSCEIDRVTLWAWRNDDATFSNSLMAAEAECANDMAACIAKAAPTDWKAAESWLKRRRREDWGDRVAHEIDNDIAQLMAQLADREQAKTP
jgi:hypothetical protein